MTKPEARNPNQIRMTKSEMLLEFICKSLRNLWTCARVSGCLAEVIQSIRSLRAMSLMYHNARALLEPKVVIGLMRPDPEPGNHVTFTYSDRAVVLADPHHTNAVAPFFEA